MVEHRADLASSSYLRMADLLFDAVRQQLAALRLGLTSEQLLRNEKGQQVHVFLAWSIHDALRLYLYELRERQLRAVLERARETSFTSVKAQVACCY
jgi:ferric iron reductase protein FhuF